MQKHTYSVQVSTHESPHACDSNKVLHCDCVLLLQALLLPLATQDYSPHLIWKL